MPDNAKNLDDVLDTVMRNFRSWEEQSEKSRAEAEEARDYFCGYQWTEEEKQALKNRKQPIVTDNKLADKVEYILGMEASSRTDPKAYPRTPDDESSAEAATDALRFVADHEQLDTVVSDIAENMCIEGFGGCEVDVTQVKDQVEIRITQSSWDRMYYDPYSSKRDFSDARFIGTFVWLDQAEAEAVWPDVDWEPVISGMVSVTPVNTTDDKPKAELWYDKERKRVRVIQQYYYRGQQLYQCKFVQNAFVEEPTEAIYLNEEGESETPYCWMSGYVDRDNNRYGVVRRFKSLQDEINHRRSKALHLMNTNQIIAEEGAVNDIKKARREANKVDGYIELMPGFQFNIEKNIELGLGQFQLLQDAQQALSSTGPQAVSNTSSSQSGRAKQLENQTDVIELGRLFDQIRGLKRQIYRKIWNRVKQYWTQERWIRITDDEGKPEFLQLNEPQTNMQRAEEMVAALEQGEGDQQEVIEAVELASVRPDELFTVKNNLSELDVDIILDDAPDTVSLQSEQFDNLVSLANAGVVFPPDVYLEASSLRNKDRLIEKLTGGDDPEAQQAFQAQAQAAQETQAAALRKTLSEARKNDALAENQELENMVAQAAVTEQAGILAQKESLNQ